MDEESEQNLRISQDLGRRPINKQVQQYYSLTTIKGVVQTSHNENSRYKLRPK